MNRQEVLSKSKDSYEKEMRFSMQGINPHSECGVTNLQALKHKLEFIYEYDDVPKLMLTKTDSLITPEGLTEEEFENLHF